MANITPEQQQLKAAAVAAGQAVKKGVETGKDKTAMNKLKLKFFVSNQLG